MALSTCCDQVEELLSQNSSTDAHAACLKRLEFLDLPTEIQLRILNYLFDQYNVRVRWTHGRTLDERNPPIDNLNYYPDCSLLFKRVNTSCIEQIDVLLVCKTLLPVVKTARLNAFTGILTGDIHNDGGYNELGRCASSIKYGGMLSRVRLLSYSYRQIPRDRLREICSSLLSLEVIDLTGTGSNLSPYFRRQIERYTTKPDYAGSYGYRELVANGRHDPTLLMPEPMKDATLVTQALNDIGAGHIRVYLRFTFYWVHSAHPTSNTGRPAVTTLHRVDLNALSLLHQSFGRFAEIRELDASLYEKVRRKELGEGYQRLVQRT